MSRAEKPGLLCICCAFRPDTLPTANRASKLVERLLGEWRVTVITEAPADSLGDPPGLKRVTVPLVWSRRALTFLRKLRFDKLIELLVWPDPEVLWVPHALRAALSAIRGSSITAIVVFMMPYSSGFIGVLLKRMTGIPLVLNFDDSPTCSDMHPSHPTALHHRLANWVEERLIAEADATVYVSETTRSRVAERLRPQSKAKLKLIRYGADCSHATSSLNRENQSNGEKRIFTIRYIGALGGWLSFVPEKVHIGKWLYQRFMRLGRINTVNLDHRSSSLVFLGRAVKRSLVRHPAWRGRVRIEQIGNRFPRLITDGVLERERLRDLVELHGVQSNDEAVALAASAEMLFLTLPARVGGSRGGRISAKTYEYLATDRPILAALPPGENFDFLTGHDGVFLCEPLDEEAMARAFEAAAEAFFAGSPLRFDRSANHASLSYDSRAREMSQLLDEVVREHSSDTVRKPSVDHTTSTRSGSASASRVGP